VRVRAFIAAAGVCAAACSKPQAPVNPNAADGAGRDLRLGSSLTSDAPVVSDLEAGRPPHPTTTATVENRKADAPKSKRTETAVAAVTAVRPKMAVTTSAALTQAPAALAMAPMAESPSRPTLVVGGGLNSSSMGDDQFPRGQRRGPAVIIRGGVGGPDDDCDIRHPRSHGGIAVHSFAPAPGNRSGRGIH
jgi:hypothetical protein